MCASFLDIDDSTNITGMAQLMNKAKVSEAVDIDSIEREIVGGLDDINFGSGQTLEDYQRELDDLIASVEPGAPAKPEMVEHTVNPLFLQTRAALSAHDDGGDDDARSVVSHHSQEFIRHAFNNMDQTPPEDREFNSYQDRMTMEQKNKVVIDKALGGLKKEVFSLQKVKDDEKKYRLISNIEQLITALKSYKVDIQNVKVPSINDDLEQIETLYKSLLYKFDSIRYVETGMNLLTLGVYVLEWMFDGKKRYFGVKPNLDGWHSTAAVKMQRVSYPISQRVSAIMNDFEYDDLFRIGMELIPSALIHMKNKADESESGISDSLVADNDVKDALNELQMQNHDFDEE